MDQTVERGQIWRRKKDGVLVRIEAVRADSGDCYWQGVDEPRKRGNAYDWTIVTKYELVENGMTRLAVEWARWKASNPTDDPYRVFAAGYEHGQFAPIN